MRIIAKTLREAATSIDSVADSLNNDAMTLINTNSLTRSKQRSWPHNYTQMEIPCLVSKMKK